MTLRTRDVAHLLDTTPAAVHKLVQDGRLKAIRRGRGKAVKYDSNSVAGEMARRSTSNRKGNG